jgi:hypothetical protein
VSATYFRFLCAVACLALYGCDGSLPQTQQRTSALSRPPVAQTPWAVLDNGIALIESKQADDTTRLRRDHWALAHDVMTGAVPDSLPQLDASLDDLDLLALVSRPEIRGNNKSLQDVKTLRDQTMQNFPAIHDTLAQNLTRDQWMEFINHFTEGLVRIHTLPVTMKDEESRRFLRTMQRQAMTAAVLTQVHLAYNDYQLARAEAITTPSQANSTKVWSNYAVLMQSLGADALPPDAERLEKTRLSAIIGSRLEKTDPVAIQQWILYTGNQSAPPDVGVNGPELPGLQLVSYTAPSLPVEIPLAQKLSSQPNVNGRRVDSSAFVRISHGQIQSLLDAPISEP